MIYLLSFLSFLALWLACGFVAAGWTYAYFQTEFALVADKYRAGDRKFAWVTLAFGLDALYVNVIKNIYRHGWRKWW